MINDRDAIGAMPDTLRTAVETQLVAQLASVPTFVEHYTASNDNDSIRELISSSLRSNNDVRRWTTGDRGWRENLVMAQVRKQGSTSNSQTQSGADWRATDQLQYRTRGLFGWRGWRRIGTRTSRASATEFASGYDGVPAYYNVSGAPRDRSLRIAAIATKRQSQVSTRAALGMTANAQPLAVAAMAGVEFRRPRGSAFVSLGSRQREYSNLFNPFWEARLVPIESALGL